MKKSGVLNYALFIFVFTAAAIFFLFLSTYLKSEKNTSFTSAEINEPLIIIDAGHGGEDGGAVGTNDLYEKDVNLKIAFLMKDMLSSRGYDVLLTRSEDILLYDRNVDFKGRKKALDLAARVKIAQEHENCIFVSIHMNAFPDPKYSGLQVYYSTNNEESKMLADQIQLLVKETLQPNNNRKTKAAKENIFVLDRITSPAILVECGFLSNPEECAALSDAGYLKKLSLIICEAVEKYMSNTLENQK